MDERRLLEHIEKSGLYYPNKFARIYLQVLEDTLGKNKLDETVKFANLCELIDNYPPKNMAKEFDFACFSALNKALDKIYGPRGGRGLAQMAGRGLFINGLSNFGALYGIASQEFINLPLPSKLKVGVPTIARIFSKFSDQLSTVQDDGDSFLFSCHRCPICWGRTSNDRMLCFTIVGLLKEGLKCISGGKEFRIEEIACKSRGAESCTFRIQKEPLFQTETGL